MLNLIQKLTKLLNTEVTQFRQTVIFQRFLYTKTLKMLSVYYRKALRLIHQDITERNISFENKKECRKASECISTSGKHSDTKYRQCQCREASDCILTGGKRSSTKYRQCQCREASECISTSGKHSDTKYRQCQCREASDCILTGGKQRDTTG